MNERVHTPLPGVPMLLTLLVLSLANFAGFPTLDGMDAPGGLIALNGLGTLVLILLWCGFFLVLLGCVVVPTRRGALAAVLLSVGRSKAAARRSPRSFRSWPASCCSSSVATSAPRAIPA